MLMKALNNKRIKKHFVFVISLLFVTLQGCVSVQLNYDRLFDKIATYDYGQDRTSLTNLSKKISLFAQKEDTRAIVEKDLLDFLKTDATFASKQFVCRELRLVGSEKSVSVLSDLLQEDKTTNIARYALERIKGDDVDEMLIDLLPDATKKVKIGIINTLAVRKSQNSVQTIGELLKSSDNDIAIAAASALGKIANLNSMKLLERHFNSSNRNFRNTIFDSYLLSIDNTAKHNKSEANLYYKKLYKQDLPQNIKLAALNGIINTSKDKENEILERIKYEPDNLKSIAISKIRELPDNTDITAYAELLKTLPPANQIQLLSVFEDKKDKSVKPFVLEALNSDIKNVKIAAIRTLANIGDKTDIIKLAEISVKYNGDISRYAAASLALLKGEGIDKTIISLIPKVENKLTPELIKAAGARLIKSSFPTVLSYANSNDKKIRSEVFKTLAEISSDTNLNKLLAIFSTLDDNSSKNKLERTISKVLVNYPDKNNASLIINKYNSIDDSATKSSLLRLAGFTNDTKALNLLRRETKHDNLEIKSAAVQGLSNFTTPEPMNDLLKIMISEKNNKIKTIALRGFVNFVSINENLGACDKVEQYKKALPFAETSNERNLVLDGIGHSDCFESLEVIKQFINQPDVKQTVDDCINRVSWHLHKEDPERVKNYVLWFLSRIKDERFQEKNKFLINVIDKYIKTIDTNLK